MFRYFSLLFKTSYVSLNVPNWRMPVHSMVLICVCSYFSSENSSFKTKRINNNNHNNNKKKSSKEFEKSYVPRTKAILSPSHPQSPQNYGRDSVKILHHFGPIILIPNFERKLKGFFLQISIRERQISLYIKCNANEDS